MEKRRPLRRQPNDHNFGSLMILAVIAGTFSPGHVGCHKGVFLPSSRITHPLNYRSFAAFAPLQRRD
jgi:hypothetical protein